MTTLIFDQLFKELCEIFNDSKKEKEFVKMQATAGCTTKEFTTGLFHAFQDYHNEEQVGYSFETGVQP
jgi:hypothetical protein